MPWTTPRTWVTSEIVTAAMMNSDVRNNSNFLHDTHGPLWIPARRMEHDAAIEEVNLGSGATRIFTLNFDWILNEFAWDTEMLPDVWISSGFTVKVWWAPTDTGSGNVAWYVHLAQLADGDQPTEAPGSVNGTFAAPEVANEVVVSSLGATGAPTANNLQRIVVERRGTADDYAALARLFGVELEFT